MTAGAALLTLSCLFSTRASAATFDGIYAFGDSLVDNGNFYRDSIGYDVGNQPPPFPGPPYPSSPYYQGRFSNGPMWVDDLVPLLGLPGNSLKDYAIGGSTSGYNHSDPRLPPNRFPGLLTQIQDYTTKFPQADPNALYIIGSGSNDYGDPTALLSNPSTIPAKVATTIGSIDSAVTTLVANGARNILVVNVPDFGKVPGATSALPPQVLPFLTDLANAHNTALAASLQDLNSRLDAKISLLDLYSLMDGAISNPVLYGFTNVTDGCFNLSTNSVCSNPNQYLFWDYQNHPTAAAGQNIAKFAVATLDDLPQSVPEPSGTAGILTFAVAGAGYLLKRLSR